MQSQLLGRWQGPGGVAEWGRGEGAELHNWSHAIEKRFLLFTLDSVRCLQ